MKLTLTPKLIAAASLDAGNAAMHKAGRNKWNEDDYNAAAKENNRLWNLYEELKR